MKSIYVKYSLLSILFLCTVALANNDPFPMPQTIVCTGTGIQLQCNLPGKAGNYMIVIASSLATPGTYTFKHAMTQSGTNLPGYLYQNSYGHRLTVHSAYSDINADISSPGNNWTFYTPFQIYTCTGNAAYCPFTHTPFIKSFGSN